eukprot:TRINITY_DN19854_c0_g1_i1.p1 TRINITY_DN19854_c0_g1~~TRINITY_DN19854_c0_g1_i1.p1  ORF type:complete len:198 (+),score=4.09 TRINITY_DN19854_c0_g1_i1:92-685(+)
MDANVRKHTYRHNTVQCDKPDNAENVHKDGRQLLPVPNRRQALPTRSPSCTRPSLSPFPTFGSFPPSRASCLGSDRPSRRPPHLGRRPPHRAFLVCARPRAPSGVSSVGVPVERHVAAGVGGPTARPPRSAIVSATSGAESCAGCSAGRRPAGHAVGVRVAAKPATEPAVAAAAAFFAADVVAAGSLLIPPARPPPV